MLLLLSLAFAVVVAPNPSISIQPQSQPSSFNTPKNVISTEAAHSLIVSSAVEKSAFLPKQHHPTKCFLPLPFRCHPPRSGGPASPFAVVVPAVSLRRHSERSEESPYLVFALPSERATPIWALLREAKSSSQNHRRIEALTPVIINRLRSALPAISTENTRPRGILPFASAFKRNVREPSFQLQAIRVKTPFS
jgi:hypothetical protein